MLRDGDVSWHIAAGRWILQHRAIPTTDPFSYTVFGHPWVDTEWLAEIIYAPAYNLFGHSGSSIVVIAALIALNAAIFFYLQRRVSWIVIAITLVALDLELGRFAPRTTARPILATAGSVDDRVTAKRRARPSAETLVGPPPCHLDQCSRELSARTAGSSSDRARCAHRDALEELASVDRLRLVKHLCALFECEWNCRPASAFPHLVTFHVDCHWRVETEHSGQFVDLLCSSSVRSGWSSLDWPASSDRAASAAAPDARTGLCAHSAPKFVCHRCSLHHPDLVDVAAFGNAGALLGARGRLALSPRAGAHPAHVTRESQPTRGR